MVRTQIQFTERQLQSLRELSAATGRSIADLTRDAVAMYLQQCAGPSRDVLVQRAIAAAGKFGSGSRDVSRHHDQYLSKAFEHDIR